MPCVYVWLAVTIVKCDQSTYPVKFDAHTKHSKTTHDIDGSSFHVLKVSIPNTWFQITRTGEITSHLAHTFAAAVRQEVQ